MTRERIGLVVGTESEYARRVLQGVSRFSRETGRGWLFTQTSHFHPALATLAAWEPAGVIAHLIDQAGAEAVAALGKPVVNVGFRLERPRMVSVGNDDAGIARAAAVYYLGRHFRRFAFVGRPGMRFSDLREAGYVAAVQAAGFSCDCYRDAAPPWAWPPAESPGDHDRLRDWVAGLRGPVAVMACNDVRAWEVLQACTELGRRVPEEIAVVGADNDEAYCLLAHPPLSSVAVAAEQIGFVAAANLALLLDGKATDPHTAILPVGVVTRQSSDTLALTDETVVSAVRYIREHAYRPLSVEDVLAAVPVSRRALERAFRKALGRSPAEEICRAHLRRATELLATTELSMADVARLSGFTGGKQLAVVFRRELGSTPTAYRAERRPPAQIGQS